MDLYRSCEKSVSPAWILGPDEGGGSGIVWTGKEKEKEKEELRAIKLIKFDQKKVAAHYDRKNSFVSWSIGFRWFVFEQAGWLSIHPSIYLVN